MPEQQTAENGQQQASASETQTGQQQTATQTQTTDDGKGGKSAVLADLAKERDARQALEQQIADLKKAQEDQTAALAAALGVKAEDASGDATTALAEQVKALQAQMAATEREATILKLAANPGSDAEGNPLPAIPPEYHHLLTATDADALVAQAQSVAALVAAKATQDGTPGFAASAGQGQNGGPTPPLPAQIAAAETELRGKTPGTPEHRAAQQRVASLKSQQLAQIAQGSR